MKDKNNQEAKKQFYQLCNVCLENNRNLLFILTIANCANS